MSNALLAQLKGHSLSAEQLERLRALVRAEQDTALGLLLQRLADASEDGVTINLLSDDEELSPNDAANLLKMSRPHLLKFMKDGHLPYHNVGSHKRIKMSDLREFMETREAGAEIVANALHGTRTVRTSTPSKAVVDELNDL